MSKFYAVNLTRFTFVLQQTLRDYSTMLHPELKSIRMGKSHWPALGGSTHHQTREWKQDNQFEIEGFASSFFLSCPNTWTKWRWGACLSLPVNPPPPPVQTHTNLHLETRLILTLCLLHNWFDDYNVFPFLPFQVFLLFTKPARLLTLFIYLFISFKR